MKIDRPLVADKFVFIFFGQFIVIFKIEAFLTLLCRGRVRHGVQLLVSHNEILGVSLFELLPFLFPLLFVFYILGLLLRAIDQRVLKDPRDLAHQTYHVLIIRLFNMFKRQFPTIHCFSPFRQFPAIHLYSNS